MIIKRGDNVPANLQQIVQEQEQQLSAEKFTSQELELVRNNLYQIDAVLEGKAVIEP